MSPTYAVEKWVDSPPGAVYGYHVICQTDSLITALLALWRAKRSGTLAVRLTIS